MKLLPFVVAALVCVAPGCGSNGDVERGEDAAPGIDARSPRRADGGDVDAGGPDGGVPDAGSDETDGGDGPDGGDLFVDMLLCAPGVLRPGESVFVDAHPAVSLHSYVVTRAAATGPCSIVEVPGGRGGFRSGIPFDLDATAPGTCEVEITVDGIVADTGERNAYRGTMRIEIEDAPGLREASESPLHPTFCGTRGTFDPDVPMLLDGRRWCRSFMGLSVAESGAEPVLIGDEHVVALVDDTTVLTRDLFDPDLFRLRDAPGGLLSEFRAPGATWQSDGRGRLVRITEPTDDLVRFEWFTVVGGSLTAGAVNELPMKTEGPVRYWSGALMSALPSAPGSSYAVGWRFHDRASGDVVHEVPRVAATEVLALDALVLDDRLYTSLEDLIAGHGVELAGLVVEDSQVEGASQLVTVNSVGYCSGETEVSLYGFDGEVSELGRGHVYNWEPLARFVAYDGGILWAETWGWTGYLAPVTVP